MVSRRSVILGALVGGAGLVAALTTIPRVKAYPNLGSIHLSVNPTYATAGNDIELDVLALTEQGDPYPGITPQVMISTDGGTSFKSTSSPIFIPGKNQTDLDGKTSATIAFPEPGNYIIELYAPGSDLGEHAVFSNTVGVSISQMSEAVHTYRVTGFDNHGQAFSDVLTVGATSSIEAAIGQLETYGYTDLKYTLLT